MILKNNLYSIQDYRPESKTFELSLHADHYIYSAHFPGRPITPGVCIVQIAKELMEELTAKKLQVSAIKNVKFLSVISPEEQPNINFTITKLVENEGAYSAQIQVTYGEVSYAKISLTCV